MSQIPSVMENVKSLKSNLNSSSQEVVGVNYLFLKVFRCNV